MLSFFIGQRLSLSSFSPVSSPNLLLVAYSVLLYHTLARAYIFHGPHNRSIVAFLL